MSLYSHFHYESLTLHLSHQRLGPSLALYMHIASHSNAEKGESPPCSGAKPWTCTRWHQLLPPQLLPPRLSSLSPGSSFHLFEFNHTPSPSGITLRAFWLLFCFAPFYYETLGLNGSCPVSPRLSRLIFVPTNLLSNFFLQCYPWSLCCKIQRSPVYYFLLWPFRSTNVADSAFHEIFFSPGFSHIVHHHFSPAFTASSSQLALLVTFPSVGCQWALITALPRVPTALRPVRVSPWESCPKRRWRWSPVASSACSCPLLLPGSQYCIPLVFRATIISFLTLKPVIVWVKRKSFPL